MSAADGSYALPLWSFAGAESAGLQITAEGHEIDWLGFSVADRVAEVAELHQPSTRIGFVRDGEGRPVAGARVEVVSGNAGQDCYIFRWPGSAEVITDAAGRFEVTAATGREDLVRPFAPAAGTSWNWRPWQTRDDAQRDVPLAGVSRARGRVVARDTGAPVAGALVRMGTHRSWAAAVGRTDARGAFDVPIVPPEGERRHELYVAAHGFIEHEFTPGTAADLVELVPAVAVLGRLLDDEDRPVVNEEVRATQTGVDDDVAVSDECRTDSDGRFVFRALAAGRYMLVDRGSGRSRGNVEIEVVAGMTGVVMRRAAEEPVPDEPPSPPEPDDER